MNLNPVASLVASLLIAVSLVLSLDWVSATVALVLVLVLAPFTGLGWRTFWRRSVAVWIAAPLAGVTVALYGQPSGHSYFRWALADVTDGSLMLAVATITRVLAIAVPAVLLFTGIDATRFADALAQLLHLPSRFVLGALAAFRLVGLTAADWRAIALARRARGVADRAPIRRFFSQAFALLVLSLRRATEVATAMEARGFGAWQAASATPRTWARESRFGGRDWTTLVIAVVIGGAAIWVSVATGNWRFVGA